MVTLNFAPGSDVYGEKRITVEVIATWFALNLLYLFFIVKFKLIF